MITKSHFILSITLDYQVRIGIFTIMDGHVKRGVVMKSKFSISVDSDLCKWLDTEIKIKRFASRSHGVEFALTQLKKETN